MAKTRRYVSEGAEEALYNPRELTHGSVVLTDYMGGDDTVELAATCGLGRGIIDKRISQQQFLNQLAARRVFEPFKFAMLQVIIQSPIEVALDFVPQQRCSVNEYSLRYSKALETSYTPTLEELTSEGLSKTDAERIIQDYSRIRNISFENYSRLVSPGINLSRELARIILGTDQDTRFCWKIDIHSLSEFVKNQRARNQPYNKEFVDSVEDLARTLAPLSWKALMSKSLRKRELSSPNDSEIIPPNFSINYQIQETKRPTAEGLERLLFGSKQFLDHGLFFPFDYMGIDSSIASAARTSYGQGTKTVNDDINLIRYLFRHKHGTPFEMPELAFLLRAPLFLERQLIRHRTIDFTPFVGRFLRSSLRYTPENSELKAQSKTNRQGRDGTFNPDNTPLIRQLLSEGYGSQDDSNLPYNLARMLRGVGGYTKTARTGDLRNLLGMLSLRLDSHAQYEARAAANLIAEAVRLQCPAAYSAFEDFDLNSVRFSGPEKEILMHLLGSHLGIDSNDVDIAAERLSNQGERREFLNRVLEITPLTDTTILK